MADHGLHIGVDGRELLGQPTGVGRYLRQVLTQWATDATWPHRLTVFLASEPPSDLVGALPGVTWSVSKAAIAGTVWEQTRLPRAMARSGVSVLFAGGYTAPLRVACPFVVAIYDVSFCAHPEWFRWREGMRRRWLTRSAAQRADAVVTISEFSAEEIVRWLGIPRAKIVLAPPGAPAADATPIPTRRSPVVLFVGSLFNRRHIPDLINGFAIALAQVPGARLVLVGDNRTTPRIDPVQMAAALGIGGRVEWRAYVTDDELRECYRAARVFAFLSDYEGFAMTPLEALAHGVPPVLLDTAVAHEVYGAGARFTSSSPAAIAAALVPLLSDDAAHARLLAAGQAQLRRFSWAASAAVIQQALERAARTSGEARRHDDAAVPPPPGGART
ncbi:MAG: glycosyltransferase family 1 protein [Acidobacteriota bacterium]